MSEVDDSIRKTIRGTFMDALEIAARVCDRFEFFNQYEMRTAQELAKRIRSLKDEADEGIENHHSIGQRG